MLQRKMFLIFNRLLNLVIYLIGLSGLHSLNLHSSIYVQSGEKFLFLFWVPQGGFDKAEVELRGAVTSKSMVAGEREADRIKSILGDDFSKLSEKLGIKSPEEFSERIRNIDPTLQFLSIFDAKLARITGTSARIPLPATAKGNLQISVSLLTSGREVDKAAGNLDIEKITKIVSPDKVKANPYDKAAQVLWNKMPDEEIVAYNIYYADKKDGDYRKHNERPVALFAAEAQKQEKANLQGSYMISGLENERKYFISVRAVHLNSSESPAGKIVEVTPTKDDTYPPPQIIKVTQLENQTSAVIEWEKASVQDTIYYHIYRSENMTGPYKRITKAVVPGSFSTFTDSGPFSYGKTYWYRMTAMGKKLKEGPSGAAVYYQPQKKIAPPRTRIQEIAKKPGELIIKIIPLKDSDIKTYEIYRANDTSSEPSLVGIIKPPARELRDKNLDARALYCYVARARDVYGNLGEKERPFCATPDNDKILPPPYNIRGYVDQGGLVIEWEYAENELLTGFILFRSESKNKKFVRINDDLISPGQRIFADQGVLPEKDYLYFLVPVGANQIQGRKSAVIPVKARKRTALPIHNFRFYKSGKDLIFSWNQVKSGISYNVQINDASNQKNLFKGKAKQETIIWKKYKPGPCTVEISATTEKDTYRLLQQINPE